MNAETLKGRWQQMTGEVKAQWGKLTDDEILQTEGDMERLQGKIQEKYGYSKDEAKREVNNFLNRYD